jgi:kinesin family protein 6/9
LRNEAVHINVSLHYLEQVIVALHEAARQGGGTTHIPYRNSMLTSVLRDSLGGNCRTIMLACLSFELAHLDESISTSRFAQRVAAIKNKALVNEEVDPYVMVKQLKAQLREARDELAVARGDAQARFRELDEEERSGCVSLVRAFLQDDRDKRYFDEDASGKFVSIPMPNPYRVRACFEAFKEAWKAQGNNGALNAVAAGTVPTTTANAAAAPGAGGDKAMAAEVARLQRENAALLDALRQATGSSAADAVLADARRANGAGAGGGAGGTTRSTDLERPRERNNREQQHRSSAASSSIAASAAAAVAAAPSPAAATPVPAPSPPTAEELALSRARAESFEVFRRSYRKQLLIEEQKATHASKVDLARRTGESINKLRNDINEAKAKIEAHRLARGVAALAEGGGGGAGDTDPASAPPDATELSLLSSIDALKSRYRSEFSSLKDLKAEIDFLKQVVEKSRARLQADFERWWATQPQGMQEAHNKERAAAEAAAAARRPSPDPEENYIAAQRQQQQQQRDEPPASSRSNAASGRPSSARQGPPPVSSSSLSSNAAAAPRFMSDAAAIAASASALPASAGGGSRSRTTAASSPPAQPYEAWGQQQQSQAQSSVSGGRSSGFNGIAASPAATLPGGLHTTGNSSADADIATFYALKQQMLAQRQQQQQQQQQQ